MDISCRTGEERLEYLLRKRSNLFDKVPQYQLANFLNMTPVSFSRSKKKIMRKISSTGIIPLKNNEQFEKQSFEITKKKLA